MEKVKVLDKEFLLSISEQDIKLAIKTIADEMNVELKDKNPLLICVLNGSFMFASDLMKQLDFPCQISFIKLASYEGTDSTENVKQLIGLNEGIKDRVVVVLEDIVDTGITIENTIQQLACLKPANIKVATLLFKPGACKKEVTLNYVGLEIPNDFIVGYGLDYNGFGRNLKQIYTVIE